MQAKYDRKRLESLLEDFYTVSKIRAAVFDDNFTEIAQYPPKRCTFCTEIRRCTTAADKCNQSNIRAFMHCRKTRQLYTYTCHAGLMEIAAPIQCQERIIGYIMFGQLAPVADKTRGWEVVRENCAAYTLDFERLAAGYQRLHYRTPAQIHAISKVLEACASYIWLYNYITLGKEDLGTQLEHYVAEHLTDKLTGEQIARALGISRTMLYATCSDCFGMGVAAYIRKKRMQLAKQLLDTTGEPIAVVASMVGMEDYNYFTKLFKSETGLTPRDYRKAAEQNPSGQYIR